MYDNVTDAIPVWGYAVVNPKLAKDTDELVSRANASGILLPESFEKDSVLCQVFASLISFGGNCFDQLLGTKPKEGDQIIINKYSGFTMSDAHHRVISDTDIIALMEGDKPMPLWGNVLVKPHDIAETDEVIGKAKKSGIVLVDREKAFLQKGQVSGTVLAVGGNAFETWKGCVPKVGDNVLFSKGSGFVLDDGVSRIIADTDIMAIIANRGN